MNILQVTTCRPQLFWRMYQSLDENAPQLYDWYLDVHMQEWPEDQVNKELPCGLGYPQIRAAYATSRASLWRSRCEALSRMHPGDVLCFADDDMIFGPETDYDTPAAFIRANPHVGCVATQMKRRPSDPTPPLLPVYSEQALPGVMGGMLIGYEAAQDVLRWADAAPGVDYRPDDVHISGACYVAGRTNYFYHGSCTVHEWGAPGGIIDVQRANPWMHAGHQEYFELNLRKKYIFGQQWKLELTQKAHDEHARNEQARIDLEAAIDAGVL